MKALSKGMISALLIPSCACAGHAGNICTRNVQIENAPYRDSPEWQNYDSRVSKLVHGKIETMSEALLVKEETRPPQAAVQYHVAKDGTVDHVGVLYPGRNRQFDEICVAAVESMSRNPIMRFPRTKGVSELSPIIQSIFSGKESKQHQELSDKELRIMMKLPLDRMRSMLELDPERFHKSLERMSAKDGDR